MIDLPARRLRIGIALGERSAVAVARTRRGRAVVATPVETAGGQPAVEAIAAAFARLAKQLAGRSAHGTTGAAVHVALMPPLADVRLIRLPRLTRAEAEAVIRRDAARYFVGNGSPRIVGAVAAAAEGPGGGRNFLAAAAPAALVDAVLAAVRAAGWRPVRVVPAHGAWIAAAGRSRRARALVAIDGGVAHVLRVRGGRCLTVRRAPAALRDEVLEALGGGMGDAWLLADPVERETMTPIVTGAGGIVGRGPAAAAAEVAASGAARSRLELVPEAMLAERRGAGRRRAVRAAAGAVALLVAAAAVELWGVRRELAAVRADRAAIATEVSPLLATRDSIDRMGEQARAVRSLAEAAPRWTRALFDLALLLPRDAHVTSLHTAGDTLVVEATGTRAGLALQALRRAGSLHDIRLVGTVERDLEDGTTATERFRFRARLKPPLERRTAGVGTGGAAGDGGARRP